MLDAKSWPEAFINRMQAWLSDEADAFFTALARRDIGLRLNPARSAQHRAPLEDLKAYIPWPTEPVPWCQEGLWHQDDDAPVGTHPYHTAGLYYIQDPSAMAAGVLLDPQPGEWVLDIAAAPGGKATHIAARMQGEGVLVANEVGRRRATVLAMNLERMGVTNAIVTNELPDRLAARWYSLFDAVLVDAPCSGEGTFARDPQSVQAWSMETVQGHARHQITIMEQSAPLVRPGGRLLYGTCTFAPEENEGVIAEFLRRHPDFEVLALPSLPGLSAGRPEWLASAATEGVDANFPLDADLELVLRRTGRFWPHTGPGHGHFYALLRRQGEPPTDLPVQWEDTEVPGRVLRLYRHGLRSALKGKDTIPEAGLFLAEDDALYITPMDPALWQELRVLRPGWWVATLRHGRVNPDHALAMALRPEHARDALSLAPSDARIDTFLNGGFWPDKGSKGWVLATVDGFPLGWGKRGGGRLRSRYPIHLRKA